MKSPITGKEMSLTYEWRRVPFRKEHFDIKYRFYQCEESGEQFTTTDLDEWNMLMVQNLYRAKYHIPTVEEIKRVREQYGLSLKKMNEMLGFGANTYSNYEAGDVPSIPNARLIKTASNPASFRGLVNDWSTDDIAAKEDLLRKIDRLMLERKSLEMQRFISQYVVGEKIASEYTGFRIPSLSKLREMVVFFCCHVGPTYKTKMNKLLFYADFLHFRSFGQSISGTRYRAVPYGPVPERFGTLFEELAKEEVIDIHYEEMEDGKLREELHPRTSRSEQEGIFSERELQCLSLVADSFARLPPSRIVEVSHRELAWTENQKERQLIPYHYAVDLIAV